MFNLRSLPYARTVFFGAFFVAIAFAVLTNHVWEDYYITYRSSKNLAIGNGLVFTPGERLHTFTSPLGVVLPAVASLLTFNSSDAAALWIFRAMSAAAFGGAAVLLLALARRFGYAPLAAAVPILLLLTDAKSVDFTINGMETAFMLLFLAWTFYVLFTPGRHQWWQLGCAWAGLMWTRPDSFIYVGLIAAGLWLFNNPELTRARRRPLLQLYLEAGLVTTVLYLPWILFAFAYYGTPIPHTITAKGGISDVHTISAFLQQTALLPFQPHETYTSLEGTFLPSYYMFPHWPAWIIWPGKVLAGICYYLWLVPGVRTETRVASFAFFGAHAYLSFFPYFPFPWYLPPTALLALIAFGGLFSQLWSASVQRRERGLDAGWSRLVRRGILTVAGLALVGSLWTLTQVGRQAHAQQTYVEDGNRRKIGEWLKERAELNDSVFLEPLGYIGYFSGLRTHDFPGMSSKESVEAIRKVGTNWGDVIRELNPKWLVLRPHEIENIKRTSEDLLDGVFLPVQVFSRGDAISRLNVNGRKYLEHDATFTVFRRQRPTRFATEKVVITTEFDVHDRKIDEIPMLLIHAPGSMSTAIPQYATRFQIFYGFPSDAYANTHEPTDGAVFRFELLNGTERTLLFERHLDPAKNPADQGVQKFEAKLPEGLPSDATVIFSTQPGDSARRDWTCWSTPEFL